MEQLFFGESATNFARMSSIERLGTQRQKIKLLFKLVLTHAVRS